MLNFRKSTSFQLIYLLFTILCRHSYFRVVMGNNAQTHVHQYHHPHSHVSIITNRTIAGVSGLLEGGKGCKHTTSYFTNPNVQSKMCVGMTDQDLKNGMSIINLINSRGFLPTCRIMQLMLWMSSMTTTVEMSSTGNNRRGLFRDTFIDIGANIGSCSVHMASLGFPVVSVEPVQQHVDTIRGTIDINPSFHIELHHIGLSSQDRSIHATFGHGARNWGASAINEVSVEKNESFEMELKLRTLDQVVGNKRISLMKIDCEGCEWEALKGGKRTLRRVPMIKMELVQPEYVSGNETIKAEEIVQFLNRSNFEIFVDHWNEQNLYFGKYGNQKMDIDRIFGSEKFKLPTDLSFLEQSARLILKNPIDPNTFSQKTFLKHHTDIIAIERTLANKMKKKFLVG